MLSRTLAWRMIPTLFLALGAPALATNQPKILSIIPDIDSDGPDLLFIVGRHLPGGPQLTVRLGASELAVDSRAPDLIVVHLPETIPDGSYRLRVSNSHKTVGSVAAIVRDVEGAEGAQGPLGEPGADGADGQDGTSCSVSPAAGSATVNCSDGKSATVFDGVPGADGMDGAPGMPGATGTDGQDGTDGTSCTVSQEADGATISCSDGTHARVSDGADGKPGPPATAGITRSSSTVSCSGGVPGTSCGLAIAVCDISSPLAAQAIAGGCSAGFSPEWAITANHAIGQIHWGCLAVCAAPQSGAPFCTGTALRAEVTCVDM